MEIGHLFYFVLRFFSLIVFLQHYVVIFSFFSFNLFQCCCCYCIRMLTWQKEVLYFCVSKLREKKTTTNLTIFPSCSFSSFFSSVLSCCLTIIIKTKFTPCDNHNLKKKSLDKNQRVNECIQCCLRIIRAIA